MRSAARPSRMPRSSCHQAAGARSSGCVPRAPVGGWRKVGVGIRVCSHNEHVTLETLLYRLLPDCMPQCGHKHNCRLAPTLAQLDGGGRGPALQQHRQRQREQEEQRGDRVVACLGRRVCNAGKCSVCNPAKVSSRGSEGGRQRQREEVQSPAKVMGAQRGQRCSAGSHRAGAQLAGPHTAACCMELRRHASSSAGRQPPSREHAPELTYLSGSLRPRGRPQGTRG